MPAAGTSHPGEETWYLAQLKPGGFERAVANLTRQGFESFMPMRQETRRRAGGWDTRLRPLFPGYLFVEVSGQNGKWSSINATYGVSRLVTLDAGQPTPVAPELIAALQDRTSSESLFETSDDLKVGEQVRVVSGPLSDMIAEITAVPEQGRVFVFLELMGRYAKAELAVSDVETV